MTYHFSQEQSSEFRRAVDTRHSNTNDASISVVGARELRFAHMHKQAHSQPILEKNNIDLHARGILPGITIVGADNNKHTAVPNTNPKNLPIERAQITRDLNAKKGQRCNEPLQPEF